MMITYEIHIILAHIQNTNTRYISRLLTHTGGKHYTIHINLINMGFKWDGGKRDKDRVEQETFIDAFGPKIILNCMPWIRLQITLCNFS